MKPDQIKSIISKILIVAVIALLYVGAMWYYRRGTANLATKQETESLGQTNSQAETASEPAAIYQNGTYNAEGTYRSPGGTEHVAVQLTVDNDIVTAASVTAQASVPTSEFFQHEFIANFQPQVVGKNLAELNLTKVSGSSLTPKGFNDAVAKIKAQAKL